MRESKQTASRTSTPRDGWAGQPRPSAGFSLVELVLVLVIMAIVAGIAVPRFTNARLRYQADFAASRVAADLKSAQRRARFTSTSQKVTFDVAAASYTLNGMPDPNGSDEDYIVDLGREPYSAKIFSADMGGNEVITFDGHGAPDSGGTLVIMAGSTAKLVTIDAATGDVTVQDFAFVQGGDDVSTVGLPEVPTK